MKIVKSCGVRFRPEGVYIFTHVNTLRGLMTRVPFKILEFGVGVEQLGAAVLQAIQSVPENFEEIDFREFRTTYANYLLGLGFKSEKVFAKRVPFLLVILESGRIKVIPHESDANGAQLPLHENARFCDPTPVELGNLLLELRGQCK
jgi:hypothetical protein